MCHVVRLFALLDSVIPSSR